MYVLIIRNSDPNVKAEYTNNHLQQIRQVRSDIDVEIIDPKKSLIDSYLPKANILVFSRFKYDDLLDFSKASNLKWVHTTSTGCDSIASTLNSTQILLTNSSGTSAIPIAEHVFAFMLMFARQFILSYRVQIEKRKWLQDPNVLLPIELYDKRLGIIGFGRVGKRVAYIAKGFEMQVSALAYKKTISDVCVDQAYSHRDINKLLNTSDFVVNCLPLTSETVNFFTFARFQQMKSSAYFINVGRGQTVVEEDLIKALNRNIIAGAGLDVFDQEPLPTSKELWGMKNVVITPHCAGWTPAYVDRVINIFCSNLKAYLDQRPMPNLVDKNLGY